MILKPDQQQERQLGRDNFQVALGITRRDFLATAAAGIPAGAFYFGIDSGTWGLCGTCWATKT